MTTFNFDNLPETARTARTEPELVGVIEELLVNAPRPLTKLEVVAVLIQSGFEVPATTTVATYLKRLVDAGRAVKATRATYEGPAESAETDELADI